MVKTAKMIKRHWSGILQWKLSSINNGILEGLNSVIQAAKRKARGYAHFKNKIKTFNAYTLPKVHQLGGIARLSGMPNLPLRLSIGLTS
jgi:hypothetical protein